MATDKNDAFEDQSNRHFLHQFGGNSAHESQSQTDDDAIWESEEDTNELLSEMDSPCCNYWDFSKPRSIERYKNLPVNIQSNQITQKQQDDNVHPEKEIEDIAAKNVNKKQATTTSTLTDHQRFKDVTDAELESFIKEQESKNTCRKTKSDLNIFQSYLKTKHNDTRKIDDIPPHELDRFLGFFFISATKERQTNGTMEYEPTSLKSIQQSISRYLKDSNYQCNIMTDDEFHKSRQTLSAKFKNLKSLGLGNKPNAADPLTDDDINKFYSKNVMGATSPRSLMNTIYINNNYHFGLRGVTEHYNLCWGDITLKVDTNGDEYLQYCRERQTKTRQGDNLSNLRKTGPIAMENKNDHSRCPVFAYKLYRQKRPETMKKDDSPFYIQATTFQDDNYGSKLLWYKAQRLGTKSISKIIKSMATEALPNNDKRLTGHSARKGSIQKQKDAGVQDTEIVQRTGHKNVNSLLSYSNTSLEQQKKTSLMLSTNNPKISNSKTHTIAKPVETITQSQSAEVISNSNSNQSIYHGNFNFPNVHPAMSGLFTNATFHGGNFNFTFNNGTSDQQPSNKNNLNKVNKRKRTCIIDSDSDSDN
ncbi:Hypothetical predicted protein [Mytilus galloprovincialis]|uniref:ZMYM2-like/QRICH1 C-terminal domain-containing protein n=1 Tax=Mytilus galloprovincialis TaxID=29158 RepID=A0A8B6D4S9_MYTGA|nr:Hypothetical predicted protein [Mytilus galloprovincialis]